MAAAEESLGRDDKFQVKIKLFKNVNNVIELKKKAMKGQIQAAVVRPSLICSCFSVVVAANKAVHSSLHGKMKTKGIHTELIYNLSPSHKISESLSRFGIQDNDKEVLLVCIYERGEENNVDGYCKEVDGILFSEDEIPTFTDIEEIKQMYKITKEELEIGTLSEAVVCRIATKDAS